MDALHVLHIFHAIFTIQQLKAVKYSFMEAAVETIIHFRQRMNVNNFAWEKQLKVEFNLNAVTVNVSHF